MSTSASSYSATANSTTKFNPNKVILHLLRAITILSTLASIFLLCYIIRSEDAQRLLLQLLNAANGQEERKDAAVEQSAGARSIIVAAYSCLVTSCVSNYFLLHEKKNIRIRTAVAVHAVMSRNDGEHNGLSDEGFVLASLSCASHAFVSFLLFGTFRINLYNGIQPGELAAFFFGLIGLIQTFLFFVLAALVIKRERNASKLERQIGSGAVENDEYTCKLPMTQQENDLDEKDTGDKGSATDFVKMPDGDEGKADAGGEVVLV